MAVINSSVKSSLKQARKLIEGVQKADANEAETRRRVERIFESVMGYDVLKHLSRELAVHGVGDTEHMDFAIQVEPDEVVIVVEIKRVGIDLSKKHVKQASRYAMDIGCKWFLLTNGREWSLYHVEGSMPPDIRLIRAWNLLRDDFTELGECFDLISFRTVKKGLLGKLWERQSALTPDYLLAQILSESSIRRLKNSIRKEAGVTVHPEDIVSAIRKLLNDNAGSLMDKMKISLPERKARTKDKASPNDSKSSGAAVNSSQAPCADSDDSSA